MVFLSLLRKLRWRALLTLTLVAALCRDQFSYRRLGDDAIARLAPGGGSLADLFQTARAALKTPDQDIGEGGRPCPDPTQ